MTVAEFDRYVVSTRDLEARAWEHIEAANRTLAEITTTLAVHLEQERVTDQRDKIYQQRIFQLTVVVLAALLATVIPAALDLIGVIAPQVH